MKNFSLGKVLVTAALAVAMILAFISAFSTIGIMTDDSFDALGVQGDTVKAAFWSNLGIALALAGCVVALVLSLLGKAEGIAPFIFIAAGAVAIILLIVAMGINADYVKALKDSAALEGGIMKKLTKLQYNKEIFTPIFNMVVFGAVPITFGLKKMFER